MDQRARTTWRGRSVTPFIALVTAVFIAIGLLGAGRDAHAFWLYRGFPPPTVPTWVKHRGTVQRIYVTSQAVGGRQQPVYVFVPPRYFQQPNKRYPVLYLLHGFPESPTAFLSIGAVGVEEDILVAQHRMQPTILVMPYGTSSYLRDMEWANGVRPGNDWETFVCRDVVDAIDLRYRTIRSGAARAIGGLSEGGYAALNIAMHHPGEFDVIESWSGYERAEPLPSVFGGSASLLAYNSPLEYVWQVAPALRAAHTYVWFYVGADDSLRRENEAFAGELQSLRIVHRFFVAIGGHSWGLWRSYVPLALVVASEHLAHA